MRKEMRERCTAAATLNPVFEERKIAVQLEKIAAKTSENIPIEIRISISVKAAEERERLDER